MQSNCQERAFRIDTKYSEQYIFVFPGIVFPRGRSTKNNFLGDSAEARFLGAKGTEEQKNVLFPNNKSTFALQLSLSAENDITTNERFCENLWPD